MSNSFNRILLRQAAFSLRTFGPGKRTLGLCDHVREELDEVAESGHSIEECVDVLILALDLCWRSGTPFDEIEMALAAKMSENERRKWPPVGSVGEDEKVNHVRESVSPGRYVDGRWVVDPDWAEGSK